VSPDDEFVAFTRARYGAVLARAFVLTGDSAAAQDLAQDAFAALLAGWRRGGLADPEHYLQRTLTRRAVSRWRRASRRETPTGQPPEGVSTDPTAVQDDRDALRRALAALPARQRAVLVMRYLQDYPDEEIASLMGVRESTVRSQAARALEALRRAGTLDAAREEARDA
jgi:RNA polymerase sigma-70 factor (sigma-E family)